MKEKHWSSLLGTGVLLAAVLLAAVSVLLGAKGGSITTSPPPVLVDAPNADATPAESLADSTVMDRQPTSGVIKHLIDMHAVRRAQVLREEFFTHHHAWITFSRGIPTAQRRLVIDDRRMVFGERELVKRDVALWYLKQAYRELNPQERRAFLEQGGHLVALCGGWIFPKLEQVPATLNRDSLLASYDEWLMPGEDKPPWAVRQPTADRHDTVEQYRAELVARGLISAAEGK